MSDKIVQAINEVLIETSDDLKAHLDDDIKEKIANRIGKFLVKGVGNLNPVYDLFVQAHADGKYPSDSPQGRGDNLRDYANRCSVMFTTKPADLVSTDDSGRKMLNLATPPVQASSYKGLGEQYTDPKVPKAIEKEPDAQTDNK